MNMSAERLQILGDNKGPESKELNIKKVKENISRK